MLFLTSDINKNKNESLITLLEGLLELQIMYRILQRAQVIFAMFNVEYYILLLVSETIMFLYFTLTYEFDKHLSLCKHEIKFLFNK